MELHLEGKVALVIASSQGLGKAIAIQLASEGANVMLASRDEKKLADVQQEIKAMGKGQVSYLKTDITNNEDIKALVNETVNTFGTVDILINNAGGPPSGTFEQMTDEHWQNAFELNLLSYIRLIREVLPTMKRNGGKIINIASSSIKQPIPGLILSNTYRLGIVGLTKTLSTELAPHNILINTVAPGRIATDRVAYLDDVKAERLGISREEVEAKAKAEIPLGRYGTPAEFANFVTYMVSDINTYMTGQSFLVDGGMIKSI
ncbi:SDR family oxidoreductase [Bacillus carboniphilus]|uniref:SDR family oxidoreductase n=1 Tax=Bacillus carboniphilus TaxID=86663 RepID=A0ABP3FXY8_9BACI